MSGEKTGHLLLLFNKYQELLLPTKNYYLYFCTKHIIKP
jgi:hypothetical protein